ncbi:MAG: hypothetical protein ACR2KT_02840 [Methylocella sp.]
MPLMVAELLGLQPQGFDGKLRIVRPVLPESIQHFELHGLKVGGGTVDLRFERAPGGRVAPHVLAVQGALKVEFEEAAEQL